MWHDFDDSTSIDTRAADSEPASPRPSASLPSASLPITFSAHPTYTIGTRSHSFATEHLKPLPASPLLSSMSESNVEAATLSTPASPSSLPPSNRNSLRRTKSSSSSSSSSSSPTAPSDPKLGSDAVTGTQTPTVARSHSRQSSLSLSISRHSSLSKKNAKQQDRDLAIPASPSSSHRPQKHVMLNRRSPSQDFHLRRQQQQRQEELAEELSEAGEDQIPGTPTSISSFGSGMGSERDRDRNLPGRHNRSSRSSVALIESRNIQTLSSNLAMVSSPTDGEFPQQTSDTLLSTIAQKEARIAQLREELETNISELTQLKERWSQMMIEERNRQQAEATASIQEQNGGNQSVSHRLSSTGAGIWGSVVGSVSGISGASGGITLHSINAAHQNQQNQQSSQAANSSAGLASGRSSTSSYTGKGDGQVTSGSSRPTSPLPAYLNNFSSLNGLNTPLSPLSPVGHTGGLSSTLAKKGDRTSLSSLSTCSSSHSNAGDGPTTFEAGHSSQSSISSSGQPDHNQLYKEQRESRRTRRESSGLFIPPEAEEVLVNTGRALFKGFGSLLGGIRTVVSDVAESDRFQHSRQRTIDMMSGLAQTAADALPLPSHDDIYYHHQRLRLLDEEEENDSLTEEQRQQLQQQQIKEQRRRDRQREKEKRLAAAAAASESGNDPSGSPSELSGVTRSPSLVRRTSRKALASQEKAEKEESLSRSVSQLLIRDEPLGTQNKGVNTSATHKAVQHDEEALDWGIEDKELLESLEADVRQDTSVLNKIDPKLGSPIDTPVRRAMEPSTTPTLALASKKND
ncbi:hypothetical protein BGZ49_008577 [Haplosporangium sp. Z 27]|nr:hypothetical protein BGZ49_008577 [Haplosporangium sp. Z 27]